MIRTTAYQERLDALSTGAEGERLAAEYLLKGIRPAPPQLAERSL